MTTADMSEHGDVGPACIVMPVGLGRPPAQLAPSSAKCYELKEDNELFGIDVDKIKEDYEKCVEEGVYYCESCKYKKWKNGKC